jgi:teichuronic acid biosynthesis glycosyltransferase TuaC
LLEACTELYERGLAFHLYVVGDGPLRRWFQTETKKRGLSEVLSVVGSVRHDDLPDWYRAADLTVLPSRGEGVPNVLRESLACGTPFVASQVGGIPELRASPPSRLVAPGDPSALAKAMEAVLAEHSGGLVQHPSLSWAESAESLLRVLRSLVDARRSVPSTPCPV